ncbi:MAG: hemerythrin domain-containing protein [Elusimicrobia bacterium]|nr:hemerythrin domain-containing protein [Elusimicrobiota bacterium]
MKPTDILKSEHRVIEKVLARVGKACDRAEGGSFDAEEFAVSLAFFREFADKRHHGKEEDKLFPAMNRHGMPLDSGPLACMLSEHDLGRSLLKTVAQGLPACRKGDAAAKKNVVGAYREYIAFLTEHIYKEDNILFKMADQVIPPLAQAELEAQFAEFDEQGIGEKEKSAASV